MVLLVIAMHGSPNGTEPTNKKLKILLTYISGYMVMKCWQEQIWHSASFPTHFHLLSETILYPPRCYSLERLASYWHRSNLTKKAIHQ